MKNPAYMGKVEAEEVVADKFVGSFEAGSAEISSAEISTLTVGSIEWLSLEAKKVGSTQGNALAIKLADGSTVYIATYTGLAS